MTDTYDECVFRDDTLVLLEMTTRDMMEVRQDVPYACAASTRAMLCGHSSHGYFLEPRSLH